MLQNGGGYMLLEFRCTNYKSFHDEMIFSMIPAPKQKGQDYSLCQETIGKRKYKALCSSVIYGPNASGKTNIIGAMDTFRSIVLRGHICNIDGNSSPNFASEALELIPNSSNDEIVPVHFGIIFTTENFLVEYSLAIDLGRFLDDEYERKIIAEELKINNNLIFSRGEDLRIGKVEILGNLLINAFNRNAATAIAEANLDDEELFLTNGFKTMFSAKLVSIINRWFARKFMVMYSCNYLQFAPRPSAFVSKVNDEKNAAYIDKHLNLAANCFGLNSSALAFAVNNDTSQTDLFSLIQTGNANVAIPSELFESYGTMHFIDLFPLLANSLLTGSTLVLDEFDASIHPMAIMNIISIFHNDEINRNHAQLIFNTHNPIFLNSNLFRRDEIKFVERDEETHYSTHYTLADFGTSGKNGVRNNEDYMKNYFVNRYGAIKDIDFTPVFEAILNEKDGE